MPFYFAYGSCMNVHDLARTVKAKWISPAILPHFQFGYRAYSKSRQGGVADIFPMPGKIVEGVLFSVPGFQELDEREGHPHFYERCDVSVTNLETNEKVQVQTYTVVNKLDHNLAPSPYYAELIQEGAMVLSPGYQERLRRLNESLWSC